MRGNRGPRPRQVAAICCRRSSEGVQFLLVRTQDALWTFPKGQIDDGKTEAEAAAQEADEEGGVRGILDPHPFSTYIYSKSDRDEEEQFECDVATYLLDVQHSFPPEETYRDPQWFAPEAARTALTFGRRPEYAQELIRIVDLAIARLA